MGITQRVSVIFLIDDDTDGLAYRPKPFSRMRKAASLGYQRLPVLHVPGRNLAVCPDAVLAVSNDRALDCPDCVEYQDSGRVHPDDVRPSRNLPRMLL